MRLHKLALNNFRRFTEHTVEFSPFLTLIWGPNESGKSTIYDAICTALFGRERGKVVESWTGGRCAVALTYEKTGKRWRIERLLSDAKSSLVVLDGEEVVDMTTGKDEIASAISQALGVSGRAVFENTVSIRQANVSRLGSAELDAVGGEIQRVLTGTAHISASEAIKRLETSRDAVRGKARPTNPREYDRIADQLGKLAAELAVARQSRSRIHALETEMADLQVKVARDSERMESLSGLMERHKRWARLRERETELDASHGEVFGVLRRLRELLGEAQRLYKELENYSALVGRDDELSESLTRLAARRAELEIRLAETEAAGESESRSIAGRLTAILMLTAALIATAGAVALGILVDPRFLLILVPALALGVKYLQMRASGGSQTTRHIDGLLASARSEMKQLCTEEAGVLSYLKQDSLERAWGMIKTYRGLTAKGRETEAALTAALGGRALTEWEANEADLARQLSAIRREREDEFAGYAPTTEEAESWRSELASLQSSLPPAQARLNQIDGSLQAERRNVRDLAALEGEIDYLHRRKTELEFTHKAYEEAISALNAVTDSVAGEFLPALSARAADHLSKVTSGRYAAVVVKPGWDVTVDCGERQSLTPSVLSAGTIDQLYLALRMACGEMLSSGQGLPLILDDPFASFDRARLTRALELLGTLSSGNQIILMTHDPYALEWAEANPGLCSIHRLQPA